MYGNIFLTFFDSVSSFIFLKDIYTQPPMENNRGKEQKQTNKKSNSKNVQLNITVLVIIILRKKK